MLIMLVIIGVLAVGLKAFDDFKNKMMKAAFAKMAPAPSAVTTIVVKGQKWQPVLNSVGSLKAINGVQVSTDLAGIISDIAFESGKPV